MIVEQAGKQFSVDAATNDSGKKVAIGTTAYEANFGKLAHGKATLHKVFASTEPLLVELKYSPGMTFMVSFGRLPEGLKTEARLALSTALDKWQSQLR